MNVHCTICKSYSVAKLVGVVGVRGIVAPDPSPDVFAAEGAGRRAPHREPVPADGAGPVGAPSRNIGIHRAVPQEALAGVGFVADSAGGALVPVPENLKQIKSTQEQMTMLQEHQAIWN